MSNNHEDQRDSLNKYTIDLTERALSGKLDPVIGRDDEIRRTIQVLSRRTKTTLYSSVSRVLVKPLLLKA